MKGILGNKELPTLKDFLSFIFWLQSLLIQLKTFYILYLFLLYFECVNPPIHVSVSPEIPPNEPVAGNQSGYQFLEVFLYLTTAKKEKHIYFLINGDILV